MKRLEEVMGIMYKRLKASGKYSQWLFIITGIVSTLWFLIRVIPKPSRATYPCMKAAAPLMSSFIIYMMTLTGSAWLFKRARKRLLQSRILPFAGLVLIGLILAVITVIQQPDTSYANASTLLEANDPIGLA